MATETTNSQETAPRTLVVGLGVSGLATARYLAARGVPLAVTDSREQPPGLEELRRELADVALFTGGFDPQAFAAAERLVVVDTEAGAGDEAEHAPGTQDREDQADEGGDQHGGVSVVGIGSGGELGNRDRVGDGGGETGDLVRCGFIGGDGCGVG